MNQINKKPSLVKELKIGNVTLRNNLILAPMAGITDAPFRKLALKGGAGLVCSEMVSSKGLIYSHKRTKRMLESDKIDRPVSIQIFGPDAVSIAQSAKMVEESGADIVDINFGCPVPKIAKSGAGAALLSDIKTVAEIMEATVKAVKIPVTAKIRVGRNLGENLAPELVRIAGNCGISAVTIHGRAVVSGHKGEADLEAVRKAKETATIPVIGNGGIIDEATALSFFENTGCDGIMIGRGAIGDFEIFNRIAYFLETGERLQEPTWESRIDNFKQHAKAAAELYGEKYGLIRMRKIVAYYLKDMPNASSTRNKFCQIETIKEMDSLMATALKSPLFDQN